MIVIVKDASFCAARDNNDDARITTHEPWFAVGIWCLCREQTLLCRVCAGCCAGFETAQSLDTTGLEQSVQAVQGSFKLKFFLEKKNVF
jgi:hypothetical protein